MRIWLVNTAERLSFDEQSGRRMRMGLLGAHLAGQGAEVTYWTSTFNHVEKRKFSEDAVVEVREGQTIVRLRSLGYRRNISLARVRDHRFVANEFIRECQGHPKPDLIVCSLPTIEMADASTRFGSRLGIPVILDVRDLWPDLIHWSLPSGLRALGRMAITPYSMLARRALHTATGITAVADGYLEWGLEKAGRSRGALDRTIPFTYEKVDYGEPVMDEAREFWRLLGVYGSGRPVIIYIGSFIKSFDLRPIVRAAQILDDMPSAPLFVLCGAGDMDTVYRNAARGARNVLMPGWINGAQIQALLECASLAISPLPNRPDLRMNVNNKFVEYLSGGVPILVSPVDSYCANLVVEQGCGRGFNLVDSDALAAQVMRVTDDLKLLTKWRANASALFNERFEQSKVMGAWDRLIDDIMRK